MNKKSFTLKRLLAVLTGGLVLAGVGSFGIVSAQSDTENPSFVDGVVATPGDGQVTLSWDAATDNVGVTSYIVFWGESSVTEAGQEYADSENVGDVLNYVVDDLENDVTYYFAVVAVDAADNESLEYSTEASATPFASSVTDDGNPPSVKSASAAGCTSVELAFSEPVLFPSTNPGEAFTIENIDNALFLEVTAVETSADDDSTLVLTTEEMNDGDQYILTAGIAIEDYFGNPIVSGTSDTAVFSGVACEVAGEEGEEEEEEEDDVTAPELVNTSSESLTEVVLTFDEAVVLPEDTDTTDAVDPAVEPFEIYDADDNAIEVLSATYDTDAEGADDQTKVKLTTSEQTEDTEYFVSITDLADAAGNTLSVVDLFETVGGEADAGDEALAPEDISNLVVTVTDSLANLNWEASLDSAGDLVDQILYVSTDGGSTFDAGTSLGSSTTSYAYSGSVEGGSYTFRVVTVDAEGNESEGEIVTATLPETGPELWLLAAASLLGGAWFGRRKRLKA